MSISYLLGSKYVKQMLLVSPDHYSFGAKAQLQGHTEKHHMPKREVWKSQNEQVENLSLMHP